jgi:predicted aconitase
MTNLENLKINLTQEERDILRGKQGPTMQKVLVTVVLYGEALGAERLVDIEGDGHFVISWATPGIAPPLEMLDELVAAGLKTKYPFTLDPKAPLDFENLRLRPEQEQALKQMYRDQARYDERMLQLGLRDTDAYTCNPYLPEVGNIPKRGTILAWSESACAVFANSILGARTNRNGAIMDLLSNIVGKTPLAGLLTDEGRRATWLVEVRTTKLPHPQLLGAAIGRKVLEDVPFIVGLDRFLGSGLSEETLRQAQGRLLRQPFDGVCPERSRGAQDKAQGRLLDYLQEMGAACATYGAVGLYHVENITPEAVDQGTDLLVPDHATYVIDDQELQDLMASYPVMWADKEAKPEKCYIGCPHLSLRQLYWWTDKIHSALQAGRQSQLAVETTICAAPQVLQKLKADVKAYERLERAGVKLSVTCAETLFEGGVSAGEAIVTNSNKLRAYTTARFFPDEELVEILVSGEIKGAVGKFEE